MTNALNNDKISDRLRITQEGAHHLGCDCFLCYLFFLKKSSSFGKEITIMVHINGETREDYDGVTVEEMVMKEGFQKNRIAIEINGVIVSKQSYHETVIHSGDTIEVVSFVGGG